MATWQEMYPENYDENGNFVSTGGHENSDKSWNQGYDNSADHYRNQSSGGGGGSNSSSDPATNSDNELPTSSVTRTRDDPTGDDDATVTTTSSGSSSSGGPSIPNPGPDTYDDPSDVGSTEEERMIPDGDSGDGNDTFDPVNFDLGNGIRGVITNQPGTSPNQNQNQQNQPNQPNIHPPAPEQGGSSGGLLATLVAFLSALGSALGSLLGGGN